MRASLWFRGGTADLLLPHHGWLHLLEHLALHNPQFRDMTVNGEVGLRYTRFDVAGLANEVALFLRRVCEWLTSPSFEDLEHELRVLRAESQQRSIGSVARHLVWRYGANGPGLVAFDEYGLYTATPESLWNLARYVFKARNAVLSLAGPMPDELSIPLPEGPGNALTSVDPCEEQIPGIFSDAVAGIGLSGVISRTFAATYFTGFLRDGIHRHFRDEAGVGYSAVASYEPVDRDRAVVLVGIDLVAEARSGAVSSALEIVDRLASTGVEQATLTSRIEQTIRDFRERPQKWEDAWRAASDHVHGRPVEPLHAMLDHIRGLEIDDIVASAREFQSSLLVGMHEPIPQPPRLPIIEIRNGAARAGVTTFRPKDHPYDESLLSVGADHVEMAAHSGRTIRVDVPQLAAVLQHADGGRTLIRRDGWEINVEPTLWRESTELIAGLDALTPNHLRVALPARPVDQLPKPSVTPWMRLRWLFAAAGFAAIFLAVHLARQKMNSHATPITVLVPVVALGVPAVWGAITWYDRRNGIRRKSGVSALSRGLPQDSSATSED